MCQTANLNGPADGDFIATCYEVLLGRELDTLDVIRDREGWPKSEVIRSIVDSAEFKDEVLPALETGYPFLGDRFRGEPSLRQRLWTADQFAASHASRSSLPDAVTWRSLLTIMMGSCAFD